MAVSNSDTVILPDAAICLSDFQNASSRLTLVLCPPRTTDRFTIRDFIFGLVLNSGFIPVVGMAGKEKGSTDDAWGGADLFRCGAFIAARSHRPSDQYSETPPEHLESSVADAMRRSVVTHHRCRNKKSVI